MRLIVAEIRVGQISSSVGSLVWVLADILEDVLPSVVLALPLPNVVVRVLALQSLQYRLVLKSDPQEISLPLCFVQASLLLPRARLWSNLDSGRWVEADRGPVLLGAHDTRHLLQEDSVLSLNLSVPVFQLLLLFRFSLQMFECFRSMGVDLRFDLP